MNSQCTFVRKAKHGYEYGHMEVLNTATKQEKRNYVVRGTADSYYEALAKNNMALEGMAKIRPHVEQPYRSLK